MAIWAFGSTTVNLSPTANALVTPPTLSTNGGDIDANGKNGIAYVDMGGTSRAAGQALGWTDIKIMGAPNASWTVTLDTRNFRDISLRFDYKGFSTANPIVNIDVDYSLDNGQTWLKHRNNDPLVGNNTWQIYNLPVSLPSDLDNRQSVQIRFSDMEYGTGNNDFAVDNFEVSGIPRPAAPTGLTAVSNNVPQVVLSWTASTGATSYNVKRGTASGGPFTTIGNTATTGFIDTTVVDGTQYFYVVSAISAAGEGANSSPSVRSTPPPAPPTTVTATRATPPQSGTVTVSWSASTGASSYKVYRSTTAGGPYSFLVTRTTTSYADTAAINNTVYYYVVTALNSSGSEGRVSLEASTCNQTAPTITVASNNTPQVVVSWSAVAGASSYTVAKSSIPGGAATIVSTTTGTSYTDNAVNDNATYYYYVAANGAACGKNSIQRQTLLPPSPPVDISAVRATPPQSGSVTVSWSASDNAATYRVKRATALAGPYTTIATKTAPTVSHVDTTAANNTVYYYLVTAVNSTSGESRNSPVVSTAPGYVVLNEIKANPPGSFVANPTPDNPSRPESLWEYIELKGTPNYSLKDHRVVVINGSDSSDIGRGFTTLVVPLSGVVPPSGIVLIKQAGHPGLASGGLEFIVQPSQRIPIAANNNDELIVNGASTIVLARGGSAPKANKDYDDGNDAVLDTTWNGLFQTVLDTVGWRDNASSDFIYNAASGITTPVLAQQTGVPDAMTRIRENSTANSATAWWFGDLVGAPSSLAYDTSEPERLSGSIASQGAAFNAGCFLTPGAPNEPNEVPASGTFYPIAPQVRFIRSPLESMTDPYGNPFFDMASMVVNINPPAPSVATAIFNNNPEVFDDPSTQLSVFSFNGLLFMDIQPARIAANRLVTILPDNDWSRARSFVLSTMDVGPRETYAPGAPGNTSKTKYMSGFSDLSTALELDPTFPAAFADDEINDIPKFETGVTEGRKELSFVSSLAQNLAVTKEVDIEASASSGISGAVAFWVGGMANGPTSSVPSENFELRPDRDRFFSANLTYYTVISGGESHLTNITMAFRGYSKQLRTAISNESQYAAFRLNESMREGVDSKQAWGFNVEGMETSPTDDTLFIGLRAPLVPAPVSPSLIDDPSRGSRALVLRLNNRLEITEIPNDPTPPEFGPAFTLDLGGRGIRSMTKVNSTLYVIVAGLPTKSTFRPGDFAVFLWNGDPNSNPVEYAADLTGRNPEGISSAKLLLSGYPLRLVEDGGTMDWFGDGAENKDYPMPLWASHRKSREFEAPLGVAVNGTYILDTPGHVAQSQYYYEGLAISKESDWYEESVGLGYMMGGRGHTTVVPNGWIGTRALARSISSGPSDLDLLLWPLATSAVLPNDVVLGIARNKAIGFSSDNGGSHIALVWSLNSGNVERYLVNGGTTWSEARGISSALGDGNFKVAGTFSSGSGFSAFFEDLSGPAVHTVLPSLPGTTHTFANAINADAVVVGASGSSSFSEACVWRLHYGGYKITKLPQIAGALPTDSSVATGLNPAGTIVGYTYRSGVKRPCIWTFVDSRWGAYELPALDLTRDAEASDISSRGEVVGTCTTASGTRACIWLNGRVFDLNSKIGAYSARLPVGQQNVILRTAASINLLGMITGTVVDVPANTSRMYLMTPN